jgi:hypothetical protein
MPSASDASSGEVEQLEPQSPTDPRDSSREERSRQQSQDLAQPVEGEPRTKQTLDKASRKQRFTSIAQGESGGAREGPVTQ